MLKRLLGPTDIGVIRRLAPKLSFGCYSLKIAGIIVGLTGITSQVSARFAESDPDEIDREEVLSSENYNDLFSYRFPVRWRQKWQAHLSGYRVSAGSLTIKRLLIDETIKVDPLRWEEFSFAFFRQRTEDMVFADQEQWVAANWRPKLGWLQFGILGDGGRLKQFGDLGFTAAFIGSPTTWLEFYYWSVDHYYGEKKDYKTDKRQRDTRTFGLRSELTSGKVRCQLAVEIDTPLVWQRRSRGYLYDYQARKGTLQLAIEQSPELIWHADFAYHRKSESKKWYRQPELTDEFGFEKGMRRTVASVELRTEMRREDDVYEFGMAPIGHWVAYNHHISETNDSGEDPSPSSRRREFALYGTRSRPFGSTGKKYLQTGLFYNSVEMVEDGRAKTDELKFQLGLEFLYRENFRAFVNTTWDADQVWRDFPYHREPFQPFGGGNLQFLALF